MSFEPRRKPCSRSVYLWSGAHPTTNYGCSIQPLSIAPVFWLVRGQWREEARVIQSTLRTDTHPTDWDCVPTRELQLPRKYLETDGIAQRRKKCAKCFKYLQAGLWHEQIICAGITWTKTSNKCQWGAPLLCVTGAQLDIIVQVIAYVFNYTRCITCKPTISLQCGNWNEPYKWSSSWHILILKSNNADFGAHIKI